MRETGRRKNRDTEVLRDGKPGGGKNGGKQGEWGEERMCLHTGVPSTRVVPRL